MTGCDKSHTVIRVNADGSGEMVLMVQDRNYSIDEEDFEKDAIDDFLYELDMGLHFVQYQLLTNGNQVAAIVEFKFEDITKLALTPAPSPDEMDPENAYAFKFDKGSPATLTIAAPLSWPDLPEQDPDDLKEIKKRINDNPRSLNFGDSYSELTKNKHHRVEICVNGKILPSKSTALKAASIRPERIVLADINYENIASGKDAIKLFLMIEESVLDETNLLSYREMEGAFVETNFPMRICFEPVETSE